MLRVEREGVDFLDSVDLVSARQRAQFIKQAAVEVGVKEEILRTDIAKVRGQLEVAAGRGDQSERSNRRRKRPSSSPATTSAKRSSCIAIRSSWIGSSRTSTAAAFVGERTNKLMAYLAAVSRKLDEPLAIIIQSSSAAGKSALMDAVLAFVPDEERVRYSAMTGRSLFYMQGTSL